MERICLVAVMVALACAPGCRTRGSQELLERDLRDQQDRIYQLEHELDKYRRQCEQGSFEYAEPGYGQWDSAVRGAPVVTTPSGSNVRPISPSPRNSAVDANGEPWSPSAGNPRPPRVEQAPPFQGPPEVSPPSPTRPDGQPARIQNMSMPNEGELRLPTIELHSGDNGNGAEEAAPLVNVQRGGAVASITLNRQLTAGYNADERLGDEGIAVLIEPRDAEGRIIDVPGDVSIVLMDPLVEGGAARVARWDMSIDDVAKRVRPGAGILLRLPWTAGEPANPSLDVFVRFTSPDGLKLDADQSLDVNLLARRAPQIINEPRMATQPRPQQ